MTQRDSENKSRAKAEQAPPRELSADLYRVSALLLIVIGHWLAASVTYRGGRFDNDTVLAVLPWTQWLTWIFQVVPLFFLVAGYANTVSWTRWRGHGDAASWCRHRMAAVLGPTTVYVAAILVAVAVARGAGVNGRQIGLVTWAVALHLWFIPVYLLVVAVTPFAVAAQRRWGLAAPAATAMAVALVDIATRCLGHSAAGWVNYLLCWGAVYQLGIAWRNGALPGRRAGVLAVGSGAILLVLVMFRVYPVSMVGVAGQAIQNTSPPTIAMLTFATAQCAVAVAAAPKITRLLAGSAIRRPLARANNSAMGLYLWHMVPVILVALTAYPLGLLPQPAVGSATWWCWRVVWIAALSVVLVVQLALMSRCGDFFRRALPSANVFVPPLCAPALLGTALGLVVIPLWRFAAGGFAPDGRFPTVLALLYACGVGIVVLLGSPARKTSAKEPL